MPRDTDTSSPPTPAGDAGTSVFARLRLIGESTLTGNQKDLLRALLEFADPATGGRIWASPATMGRRTSRNRRNTLRLLAELESLGVVQKQRQSRDGFNIPSDRRINFDRIRELVGSVAGDTSVGIDTSGAGDTSVTGDATSGAGDTGVVSLATPKHPKEHPTNIQEGEAPATDRKPKGSKAGKAPKTPPTISWPLTLAERSDVHRLWDQWQQARFEKHRAYSPPTSAQAQADHLAAFPIEAVVFRLRQALEGAWEGLQLAKLPADYREHQARNPQAPAPAPAAGRDREALVRRVRQLPEPELRAAADRCKVADPARYSNWPLSYFKDNVPEAFIRELNGALEGVRHV